jgi:hypothetical protein
MPLILALDRLEAFTLRLWEILSERFGVRTQEHLRLTIDFLFPTSCAPLHPLYSEKSIRLNPVMRSHFHMQTLIVFSVAAVLISSKITPEGDARLWATSC